MPDFVYESADVDGQILRGVITAPSRGEAIERILAQGQMPVRVAEAGGGARFSPRLADLLPKWSRSSDRLAIVRELGLLLRAGLTVERSLTIMQGLTTRLHLRALLARVADALHAGQPLSSALAQDKDLFPESTRMLVAAGELSGRLPDVVNRLAGALMRAKELQDKAVSALIYPALLTVIMLVVLVMIFTVVLPRLAPLFAQAGDKLPWPAAILMAVSSFFNGYGTTFAVLLLLALAAAVAALRQPGVRFAMSRWFIRTRLLLDLFRRYEGAQFARNLAMLLDGGLPLNRALEAAQAATPNPYVRQRLTEVIDAVRQGRSLKSALKNNDALPHIVAELAAVGEETGKLGAMLNEAASILDLGVQTQLDRLSALLLPVITIVLGLIVGAIMTGVVSGILAANDLAV